MNTSVVAACLCRYYGANEWVVSSVLVTSGSPVDDTIVMRAESHAFHPTDMSFWTEWVDSTGLGRFRIRRTKQEALQIFSFHFRGCFERLLFQTCKEFTLIKRIPSHMLMTRS